MKLASYRYEGRSYLGALIGEKLIDINAASERLHGQPLAENMIALLSDPAGLDKARESLADNLEGLAIPLDKVKFDPPVTRPGKVIALGRNYAEHAREGGSEPPDFPMLFHKTHTSLLGHGGNIIIPPISDKIDYEAELAVIIGKTCKRVSEAEAMDYVAGYTVANDVSARDWQRRTTQFTSGKMLDTFCPLGPYLVTKDEIAEVGNLRIQTHLNGQQMQDGNTKDMIFSIPFLISYISQIATLEVGDVLLTGTPEGVGFARKPPVWMKAGDEIAITIEGLGLLHNQLIQG
ncbi:MAG: fumarylacetoacetate hydrolase family protein [Deinococcales bacterium]